MRIFDDILPARSLPCLAALVLLAVLPVSLAAGCRITAAKCVTPGEGPNHGGITFKKAPQAPPPVEIGDILPDRYMILMHRSRYGLPPVGEGWLYFRVEARVYRVAYPSREVLEDVTHLVNRAFY